VADRLGFGGWKLRGAAWGCPEIMKDKTMESNVAMENPPSIDSFSLMISPAINLHG